MSWYHYLILALFPFAATFVIYTRKFLNPYKLIMVFGKKGSGKTTLITKLSQNYLKKGRLVYSTIDIPGCRTFDVADIGRYNLPEESILFIDEVGMIWENRYTDTRL